MQGQEKYLYIPDDVVKDVEHDAFGHKYIAQAVAQSIFEMPPPFIVGIFGGWGTGKSTILTLVESELKHQPRGKRPRVARIDAWRYSSAEDLKRAFLVHIAQQVSPKRTESLRRALYGKEQESVARPPVPPQPDHEKRWPRIQRKLLRPLMEAVSLIWRLLVRVVLIGLLFFGLLLAFYWIRSLFTHSLDWNELFKTFISLSFVPSVVAIMDYFRTYVFRPPTMITWEPVDAEEVLEAHFGEMVADCTRRGSKRLAVFVDNLDRLGRNEMIEALEALKTYVNNDRCVFVVACDDQVVRSVVEDVQSEQRGDARSDQREGEEYLDKFFQLTFRLPAYMEVDLVDFAVTHFSRTRLGTDLDCSIQYLVSVILPSDVRSPRKVKRLLNEFIATYELARRRESESGQLRPGMLTGVPEFIAKMSTLRAEYPAFYERLHDEPQLLTHVTEQIQSSNQDNAKATLRDIDEAKSLIGYLRKTQTVSTGEIETYLYMSQDPLILALGREQSRRLRIALADGDVDTVVDMLTEAKEDEDRSLLAQAATRHVQHKLKGLAQENGISVLAALIEHLESPMKDEIAQVAATLMAQCPLDAFAAGNILQVLKSAERGENQKLISNLLARLDTEDNCEETFEAILEYWEVVDENGATSKVQKWLQKTLSAEVQAEERNQLFASWLVGRVGHYADDPDVIERYYAQDLTDYTAARLLGEVSGLPAVAADSELWLQFAGVLETVGKYSEPGRPTRFWSVLPKLLTASSNHYELGTQLLEERLEFAPSNQCDRLVGAIVRRLPQVARAGEISSEAIARDLNTVLTLCKRKEADLEDDTAQALAECLQNLSSNAALDDPITKFATKFISELDGKSANTVLDGMCRIFAAQGQDASRGEPYLDLIILFEDRLSDRGQMIAETLDRWARTYTPSVMESVKGYLGTIAATTVLREPVAQLCIGWLELLPSAPNGPPPFQAAVNLNLTAVSTELLDVDQFAQALAAVAPFGGNPRKQAAIDALRQVADRIQSETRAHVFGSLLPNLGQLGPSTLGALVMMAQWLQNANEEQHAPYIASFMQSFNRWP
jgi:hypothetical protein